MSRDLTWRWIWHEGRRLYDVGIAADGSVIDPRNYGAELVRAAIAAAEERATERRSAAAKKAAETRRRRQERKVRRLAEQILVGIATGPRKSCALCGRGLDDPASIDRGVGPECWGDLLAEIERLDREAGR